MSNPASSDKPVVALMAGGSGQRFWPLSKKTHPKQLLRFGGEESLLRAAFKRALLLTSLERILLVTRQDLYEVLSPELPELPRENYLLEPKGANTGPCVAFAAMTAARRFGDPVMIMLPADQRIVDRDGFAAVMLDAARLAAVRELLVVLGIEPTRPETQYGYIKTTGEPCPQSDVECHPVERFTEKPNFTRAVGFAETPGYYWNSGMFVWRASTILAALEEHSPGVYWPLESLAHSDAEEPTAETIAQCYSTVRSISIDYAVMENADNVVMVPATFGWDDLGQWTSLRRVFPADQTGNTIVNTAEAPPPYLIDSKDNLVYNATDQQLVLIDQQEMVFVLADSTVMILPASRTSDIRKVADHFDNPPAPDEDLD